MNRVGVFSGLTPQRIFEEAKSKATKFYAEYQAEYFAFDGYTRTRFVFTLEQLGYQKKMRPTWWL
jgi:hypothetical protein